jgi:hypothetical protein
MWTPRPLSALQVAGQRGGEGLALAGAHLRDATLVEEHPADELDVEVPLADRPPRRLAGEGEGLEQHVIQGTAVRHLLLQPRRLPRKASSRSSRIRDSSALMRATLGQARLSSRSFLRPDDLLQRPLDH